MTSTETEQWEVVSLVPEEKKDLGKHEEAVRIQCPHQRLEREICCRSGEKRRKELMVVDCCCEVRALFRCPRRVRSKGWELVLELIWKMLDDCRKVMVRGRGRGLGMGMDMKMKELRLLKEMGQAESRVMKDLDKMRREPEPDLMKDTKMKSLDRTELAQYSTLMMNKKKMSWDTTGLATELMKDRKVTEMDKM